MFVVLLHIGGPNPNHSQPPSNAKVMTIYYSTLIAVSFIVPGTRQGPEHILNTYFLRVDKSSAHLRAPFFSARLRRTATSY